jgi:hypothetical protein
LSIPALSFHAPSSWTNFASMAGVISLRDALHIMDSVDASGQPVRFNIAFVTRGKGEIIGKDHNTGEIVGITAYKPVKVSKPHSEGANEQRRKSNPNHTQNSTRNICIDGTDQIRKVHIRLITRFNGKQVFY